MPLLTQINKTIKLWPVDAYSIDAPMAGRWKQGVLSASNSAACEAMEPKTVIAPHWPVSTIRLELEFERIVGLRCANPTYSVATQRNHSAPSDPPSNARATGAFGEDCLSPRGFSRGRVPQPPVASSNAGNPEGAGQRGGLLWPPFLGRARKGGSRRATPGKLFSKAI
jgi:hypothetical protein